MTNQQAAGKTLSIGFAFAVSAALLFDLTDLTALAVVASAVALLFILGGLGLSQAREKGDP